MQRDDPDRPLVRMPESPSMQKQEKSPTPRCLGPYAAHLDGWAHAPVRGRVRQRVGQL